MSTISVNAFDWANEVIRLGNRPPTDHELACSILNDDSGRWFGRSIERPADEFRPGPAPAPAMPPPPPPKPEEKPMGTRFPEIFAALAAPFEGHEIKTRDGGRGRKLSYITARTAANRLDSVLGPENWEDSYFEVRGCLVCQITITLPDGLKVAKQDGGGFKTMTERQRDGTQAVDQENTDKTGFSDAFKRTCAKFGVARYLYRDGVATFAPAAAGKAKVAPATIEAAPAPVAAPSPSKAALLLQASLRKSWALFSTDAVAATNDALHAAFAKAGLAIDPRAQACNIHQLHRHLMKWGQASDPAFFVVPEGLTLRQSDVARFIAGAWDDGHPDDRSFMRAEVGRYLKLQVAAAIEKARAGHTADAEPGDDAAEVHVEVGAEANGNGREPGEEG